MRLALCGRSGECVPLGLLSVRELRWFSFIDHHRKTSSLPGTCWRPSLTLLSLPVKGNHEITRLQSTRPVGRVAELGSLGVARVILL